MSVFRREKEKYWADWGGKDTDMEITSRIKVGSQRESPYDDQAAGFQEVTNLHFIFWAQENFRHACTPAPLDILSTRDKSSVARNAFWTQSDYYTGAPLRPYIFRQLSIFEIIEMVWVTSRHRKKFCWESDLYDSIFETIALEL